MGYSFLTNPTSLAGASLLRECLRGGRNMAVLVNSTRFEAPNTQVDHNISRWEKQFACALPRPVILEGNLHHPNWGLSQESQDWLADHCDSLLFEGVSPGSADANLEAAVGLARKLGIHEFHGLFPADADIRMPSGFRSATIYRVGTLVGNPLTGQTPAFDGWYASLRWLTSLVRSHLQKTGNRLQAVRDACHEFRSAMDISEDSTCNLVSAEWCGKAITRVLDRPDLHGKTFTLGSQHEIPVQAAFQAVEDLFAEPSRDLADAETSPTSLGAVLSAGLTEELQRDWMPTTFTETTDWESIFPDLPCPEVDAPAIKRLVRSALDQNFGWPRTTADGDSPRSLPTFESLDGKIRVENFPAKTESGQSPVHLGLQINGPGGGQWEMTISEGKLVSTRAGLSPRCTATYYLNAITFEELAQSRVDAHQAIGTGRVVIEGNGVPLEALANQLQQFAIAVGSLSAD